MHLNEEKFCIEIFIFALIFDVSFFLKKE